MVEKRRAQASSKRLLRAVAGQLEGSNVAREQAYLLWRES